MRTLLVTAVLAVLALRTLLITALTVLTLRARRIVAALNGRVDAMRLIAAGALFHFRFRGDLGLGFLRLLHLRRRGLRLFGRRFLRLYLGLRLGLFSLRLFLRLGCGRFLGFYFGLFLGLLCDGLFLRLVMIGRSHMEGKVYVGSEDLHQALLFFALNALLVLGLLLFLKPALGAAHVLKRIAYLALRCLYALKKLCGLRLKLLCEIVDLDLCHSIITPVHINVLPMENINASKAASAFRCRARNRSDTQRRYVERKATPPCAKRAAATMR